MSDIYKDQQLTVRPESVESANIDTGLHPFGAYEFSKPGASTPYINVKSDWEFQSGGSAVLTTASQTQTPAGVITMYCASTAPSGWLNCDGSAVSRTTYSTLYAVTSTTFGVGDSSTTFNTPDMRGIFARGAGSNSTLLDAASNPFDGGSIGDTQNDAFQGHDRNLESSDGTNGVFIHNLATGASKNGARLNSTTDTSKQIITRDYIDDGTNGDPRTANETRPANIALNYIIKT